MATPKGYVALTRYHVKKNFHHGIRIPCQMTLSHTMKNAINDVNKSLMALFLFN